MDMLEKKDYLIVVDMQNDFITGVLGSAEAQAIVPAVVDLVKSFSPDNIWFTRDTHYENYLNTAEGQHLPVEHCIKGSDGWHVIDEVKDAFGGALAYVNKETFGYSDWAKVLPDANQIGSITLCGVCTDICVVSNVLIIKALYPEVPISVVANCCAGVTPEKHEAALETMRSCQINVI